MELANAIRAVCLWMLEIPAAYLELGPSQALESSKIPMAVRQREDKETSVIIENCSYSICKSHRLGFALSESDHYGRQRRSMAVGPSLVNFGQLYPFVPKRNS